jgi:hypothetical protein
MPRPCHIGSQHGPKRSVTFSFLVPVCVVVEDDVVAKVVVIDETDVTNPQYVDGDEDYLEDAVKASLDGQGLAGLGVRLVTPRASPIACRRGVGP